MIKLSLPALLLACTTSFAAERPLYIIFDGSNSMWGELDDKTHKIDAARRAFAELEPGILDNRELALRLYGHRRARDCSDTELTVPLGNSTNTLAAITEQINTVLPRGKTPISRSLSAALTDLDGRSADILLISDGIETCDADPCQLVQQWRDQDVDIKVHVVGLGLTDASRSAMQCIADASGTRYLDANNATELGLAIATTATAGNSDIKPPPADGAFYIEGLDEQGRAVPVAGTPSNGSEQFPVKSHARNRIPSGSYQLTVGVPTANGALYQPVTLNTDIDSNKNIRLSVDVLRPPVIRTLFIQNGQPAPGALTDVLQNGEPVFRMRVAEDYFVLPGKYQFNSSPNQDNQMTVSADIKPGTDRDIVFDMTATVHTTIVARAGEPLTVLRQHQQLWQDGEQIYKLHFANGASVKPGTYTLRSEHALTPYQVDDLQIPANDGQRLEITVPMAQAGFRLQFHTPPDTTDYRCWLEPISPSGEPQRQSRAFQCDGSVQLLAAGRYRLVPWSRLGQFEETLFDIQNGDTLDILVPQIVE
jgi:Ca-activated chloride channel family protein